jgi:four helix bundle protein
MTYDEWEQGVHQRVKDDPAWGLFGYRKALFLHDLVWKDCEKFDSDHRGKAITGQIIRSTGSISANIEEGFGRGIGGKEYLYYLRISIGSARETKGWYWRGHHLLTSAVLDHRLGLLDEIISLIATEIGRQRRKN